MNMGSIKCLNGTTEAEDKFQRKANTHPPKKKNMYRPKFYPCTKCGRKFTIRALAIHKQSCSEDADCSCAACKSLPSCGSQEVGSKIEKVCMNQHAITNVRNRQQTEPTTASTNGTVVPVSMPSFSEETNSLMQLAFVVSQTEPFPMGNESFQTNQVATSMLSQDASPNYFVINKNNEQCVTSDAAATDISGLLLLHDAGILSLAGVKIEANTDENGPEVELINGSGIISRQQTIGQTKVEVISGPSSSYVFSDRKLLCNICNIELPWEVFGNHIVQHSLRGNDDILKCPKCFKPFTRSAMLLIHFYKHITDSAFACKDCLMPFRLCDDLKSHTLNVHGYIETQPYHCYICMRRFSHPQTIINHMRLHSKETPFKCTECSRSFSQIGNLQRHLSVHRGDRPHKCGDCDKSFADPATLRNHVRIHTGETPFVCKVCHRGFTQVGNLKRHMARHLQAKPTVLAESSQLALVPDTKFENMAENDLSADDEMSENGVGNGNESNGDAEMASESCGPRHSPKDNETAIAMSQLKEQRKKHHWQLFPCPVCGKVYTWQHDLSIHFRIHTGEKPFKCDICDKRFAQSGAVRIHKSRHHHDEDVYIGS